jgi:two-component system cell cycle sensor histidine kinase/response regulator CckA
VTSPTLGKPPSTSHRSLAPAEEGGCHACDTVAYRFTLVSSADQRPLSIVTPVKGDTPGPNSHEAAQFLSAIVESSADAIIGKTLDGEVVSWNAAAERLYGYSAAEMIGRDIAKLFPPDRTDELAHLLSRLRNGETIREMPTVRVKKDGTLIPVSITLSPVLRPDGTVIGAATTARDMTAFFEAGEELKRAHRATAEGLSMLESLQDNAPIGFGFIDLECRIVRLNDMLAAVHGSSVKEQLGRPVKEVVPELWAELEPVYRRVLDHGESVVNLEVSGELAASPGKFHHWLASYYPVRVDGEIVGLGIVVFDISDRKQAEADHLSLEARLNQSDRLEVLGQLAGGIAHDFNNLLAVIISYADFVADETSDRPAVLRDVNQIQAAAVRAAGLTKQLLIFSRREKSQPEALALNSIVKDVETLLSRSIGAHIEIRVELGTDLPAIRADRGQIEQVLLNLAVNSRDAMPDGGTLTIETRLCEIDEDYTHSHPEINPGHYVELSVSDTGEGMSAEISAHIYEPFFTTKPPGEGTGLGLSIIYGIVTEAGGSMDVYSEEGIGTTFRICWPATDLPAEAESNGLEAFTQGSGETIIVVDDERSVLTVTSRILRRNGYVTLDAVTCEEALSLAAANDFQLLLTDSVMPHMSGPVLAGRINELKPGRAVLFMSGYRGGVLDAGAGVDKAAALIQKPFNRHDLLEKVHSVLMA